MRYPFMAALLLGTALPAAAQITNPVTNPNTTSPSTSTAVPRVGENVDEATSATEQSSRQDALTPGPTTQRDRRAAETAHKRGKHGGHDMYEPPKDAPKDR